MSKQSIGIGSAANDGTGDALRTAFDKANQNFTEVYGMASGFVKPGSIAQPTVSGAGFTKIENTNLGSGNGALTDTTRGVTIKAKCTTSSDNICLAEVTPGSTWTLTALLKWNGPWRSFSSFGLYAKNNSNGKICQFGIGCITLQSTTVPSATVYLRNNWTTVNAFSAQGVSHLWTLQPGAPVWMKLQNDGTSLIFSLSYDGENFITVETYALATFITTADRCGLINCNNQQTAGGFDAYVHALSYALT